VCVCTLTHALAVCSIPLLVPFALALELKPLVASNVWTDGRLALIGAGGVVGAGLLSFLLILLELAIVRRTSALTTDVIGYVKSITLIVVSSVTYGDALSTVNLLGVVLTFSGALLYSWMKRAMHVPNRSADDKIAYEILSVLEMAQNWSDDEADDVGLHKDPLDAVDDAAVSQDGNPAARRLTQARIAAANAAAIRDARAAAQQAPPSLEFELDFNDDDDIMGPALYSSDPVFDGGGKANN
jgi:hypothetical protein